MGWGLSVVWWSIVWVLQNSLKSVLAMRLDVGSTPNRIIGGRKMSLTLLMTWIAAFSLLVPVILTLIVMWCGLFVVGLFIVCFVPYIVSIAGFLCGCRRVRFLVRWVWLFVFLWFLRTGLLFGWCMLVV